MSNLLTQIIEQLNANANVEVVDTKTSDGLVDPLEGGWTQVVQFFVAPAGDGLHNAEALQAFLVELVSIPWIDITPFTNTSPGLSDARLFFVEVVGREVTTGSRTITITDPDIEVPADWVDGSTTINTQDMEARQRLIVVRCYRTEDYAHQAVVFEQQYPAAFTLPSDD